MILWLPPEMRENVCVPLLVFIVTKVIQGMIVIAFLSHVVPFEVVACPSWCFLSSRHRMSFSEATTASLPMQY